MSVVNRADLIHATQRCTTCKNFAWTPEMWPVDRGGWHHPSCPTLRGVRDAFVESYTAGAMPIYDRAIPVYEAGADPAATGWSTFWTVAASAAAGYFAGTFLDGKELLAKLHVRPHRRRR